MCALMRWGMRRTPEGATEETEMSLTGKFAFRRSLTGKIVLKVEEEVKRPWPLSRTAKSRTRWRDAKMADLTEAEMRTLMDLRNRPQLVPQSAYATALAQAVRQRDRVLSDDASVMIDGVIEGNGHAPTNH
jgi:hypothetical protein